MKKMLIVLALAVPALQAHAQEPEAPPADAAPATVTVAPGDESRAWMDLQASGNAASPTPASVPGEVADRVYARYLKSFEQPIPERLEREKFTSK